MSRGKARARKRARSAPGPRAASGAGPPTSDRPGLAEQHVARIESARRRARVAKSAFVAGGIVVFTAAMGFARMSYPGHAKSPAKPLSPPPKFVKIVRRNLLQAGIVAPAQAPPGATTSVS